MKKILFLTFIMVLTVSAFPQETVTDTPFKVYHPEIMAMGGIGTATAHGYSSLFTNPAGFSREDGGFTVLSLGVGAWGSPSALQDLNEQLGQSETTDDLLSDDSFVDSMNALLLDGGVGLNANAGGIGIVGKGLGLGILHTSDFYASGESLLGVGMNVISDTALVAGLSFKMSPFGFPMHVGADIRPFYRARTEPLLVDVLPVMAGEQDTTEFDNTDFYEGFGVGIDGGIIAELGVFTLGLSLRDMMGTKMVYQKRTMNEALTGAEEDQLEVGNTLETMIPMTISLGVGFDPDLGMLRWLIDPSFAVEYHTELSAENDKSFLTQTHIGAEVKVLRFINLRAGLNGGNVSMGAGVHLLFLDVNVAVFSEELGNYASMGERRTGYVAEIALRF